MTYALIAANIVIFLISPTARSFFVRSEAVSQTCQQEAYYNHYGAIPREMTTNRQLEFVPNGHVGTSQEGQGCLVGRPKYTKIPFLSVLSAMFLHGSWLHLFGNMLFLWVFGNNIEDRLGRIKFLAFYLFCGYAAAYGFAAASPNSREALIGASGAIAGTLGAYIVLYPRAKVWSLVPFLFFIPLRLSAWIVLGLWFVLQWLYSAGFAVSGGGSVAYLAHVVGFAVGAAGGLLMRGTGPRGPRGGQPRWNPPPRAPFFPDR